VHVQFILNPRAGTGRDDIAGALRAAADAAGVVSRITPTTHRGHATELARAAVAAGCDAVVAVGGDGTVNEAARALIGTPVALGLVPRGSGNGLARQLGVPLGLHEAVAALARGNVRVIDTAEANGHVFLCAMGIGFDAAVVRRFETLPRRGFAAYLGASALELLRHRPAPVTITGDDPPSASVQPLLVAVANAAQFGNGAIIAPHAQVDDGALDLVVVDAVHALNALPLVWRLFRGTLDRSRHATMRRGAAFTLERAHAGPMHVDGELVETGARIDVRIRTASLRVLAPAGPAGTRVRAVQASIRSA
jgi:YegS/Rv2252/BmrU family lipid kinase